MSLGLRRTADLPTQIASLKRAVELSAGRVDDAAVSLGRHVVAKADARLELGSTNTVAALLGATGSGKSSLANAIAATDVATTGVRRPTTSSTLALSWGGSTVEGAEQDPSQLLDWLEIQTRHHVGTEQGLDGLVLLDVPDHDSVAVEHRLEMERVAEQADLLVWVTDPEKYADAALHAYLRMLSSHGAVMLVVLNKSDQLGREELALCRRDLARLLEADGIADPTIITASARTGDGIAEIKSALSQAVSSRETMQARLEADVQAAAADLVAAAGEGRADAASKRDVRTLIDELLDSTGIDAVTAAVEAGRRRDARAALGWPYTRWIGRLRPHPLRRLHLGPKSEGRSSLPAPTGTQLLRAETAIRSYADTSSDGLPPPWPDMIRQAARPDPNTLRDRLDRAVADAVRGHTSRTPRWWRLFSLLQWLVAAVALAGGVWLLVLFGLAWLRIPEPPTPELGPVPVPTVMFLGGIAVGLLIAWLTRPFAGVSARRASQRVRKSAGDAVREMAEELVIEPVGRELSARDELMETLRTIGS